MVELVHVWLSSACRHIASHKVTFTLKGIHRLRKALFTTAPAADFFGNAVHLTKIGCHSYNHSIVVPANTLYYAPPLNECNQKEKNGGANDAFESIFHAKKKKKRLHKYSRLPIEFNY